MLSRKSILAVSRIQVVESTRWLYLDIAEKALAKWIVTDSVAMLHTFLLANDVVQECFDEIEGRQLLLLGTDRGQVEKWR